MDTTKHSGKPFPRRILLYLGTLFLVYPLLRFINHRVPPKPHIVEVSGSLNKNGFLTTKDFIIFSSDDELWAVSRTCTHLGCHLSFKEKEGLLECPCHQSRFTPKGGVINGPASDPLPVYSVQQKGEPPVFIVTM